MEIADYIIADDRALVELVLQGDNIAFEYLFERYRVIRPAVFVLMVWVSGRVPRGVH